MRKTFLIILVGLFFLFFSLGCSHQSKKTAKRPYLVVLSVDGFRWDYPVLYPTPNLDKIALEGVKAESMQPSFPSKTFPNHLTLVTGLYPDHHGIVMNSFRDSLLGDYSLGNREAVQNPGFYQGEPIWVTAEKQGIRSAVYFWPGSEAKIGGYYPSIYKEYQHNFPFDQRVDSMVSWLTLPYNKRPKLVMGYFHEPDMVGHHYGPESKETRKVVITVDSLIGVFYHKLKALPIADSINFIVLSDHGMGAVSDERLVVLNETLKEEWIADIKGWDPAFLIQPKEEYKDSVYLKLKNTPHISTWWKQEVPDYLHYGTNRRIYNIVCVADSSYGLVTTRKENYGGGGHGYDPRNKDMHAIFYAVGPDLKSNYRQPTFENIHVYSLMVKLLGLQPAKNYGGLDDVKGMLKQSD